QLSADPKLLFNIGQAFAKVPNPDRAQEYFTRFLAAEPRSKLRPVVLKRLDELSGGTRSAEKTSPAEVEPQRAQIQPAPLARAPRSSAPPTEAQQQTEIQARSEVQAVMAQRRQVDGGGDPGDAPAPTYKKW